MPASRQGGFFILVLFACACRLTVIYKSRT
jgi:hypothetical protein